MVNVEPTVSAPEAAVTLARVLVIHGYGATPDAHWFPWLAEALRSRGVDVDVVELPAPDAPDARSWTEAVRVALGEPDPSTWIVAHSLGGITALRALAEQSAPWRLGGLVLVSGFTGRLASLPLLDAYLADDVDAEALVDRIGARFVLRSDADAYVPIEASDALARRLDARVHIEPGAGHFLADDGITRLPALTTLLPLHAAAFPDREEIVREYIRRVDAGDPALLDLYTDDVELWFPTYGTGRGKEAMRDFAAHLGSRLGSIEHDIDGLEIMHSGDRVVVEGREWGTTADGASWPEDRESGGRFCNVFVFRGDLISSVHIYVDPDFASSPAASRRL